MNSTTSVRKYKRREQGSNKPVMIYSSGKNYLFQPGISARHYLPSLSPLKGDETFNLNTKTGWRRKNTAAFNTMKWMKEKLPHVFHFVVYPSRFGVFAVFFLFLFIYGTPTIWACFFPSFFPSSNFLCRRCCLCCKKKDGLVSLKKLKPRL